MLTGKQYRMDRTFKHGRHHKNESRMKLAQAGCESIILQWLKEDFLAYLDRWEESVTAYQKGGKHEC